jgi:hypothetical protein
MNNVILSKSRFVSGSQCEKKLFFDINRKDLKQSVPAKLQAIFDTGHQIGKLAHKVFPGGQDATPEIQGDFSSSIEKTLKWIEEGVQTIYEATFSKDGGFAALDILHHVNGQRWAIEVKSSTSVHDYYITDASFQYWVMNRCGHAPDKMFLMHINNKYVKDGEIDPKSFFTLVEITESVLANQENISIRKEELVQMLNQGIEPEKNIGKHCGNPFSCDYIQHCWNHIPKNSVFNLASARGKDWKLYEQGINAIEEIPDDFKLTHRQRVQVNGVKFNTSHADIHKVRDFLLRFTPPLYFFDFETINPAIPVLNGTSPFNQTPFQYSLHITDDEGNITNHSEFLAEPKDFQNPNDRIQDPRYKLIRKMKHDIKKGGSLVAYNSAFEITRLKELALAFPEEKEFLEDVISRFVDLLVPFRSAWYYLPEMGASASIKSVLPAIAPEFSYNDLEISNGGLASETFLSMVTGEFNDDALQTRENLLKYCERDTEGMVIIYRHLKSIVKNNSPI